MIIANSALIGKQRACSVLLDKKVEIGVISLIDTESRVFVYGFLYLYADLVHSMPNVPQSRQKFLFCAQINKAYQALQENRKRQETPEFRALYAKRAGIEGTVAQAVRTCEIRRSRYIGQKKLNLQAFLTATSMNVLRACHWVAEEKHATAPSSRFAKLVASVQHVSAA